MDINFQSGEFYNDPDLISTFLNVGASLIGALVSALIAIWIFNKGYSKQRLIEREKENQRLRDGKTYFETLVNLLIGEPIEKRIRHSFVYFNQGVLGSSPRGGA